MQKTLIYADGYKTVRSQLFKLREKNLLTI